MDQKQKMSAVAIVLIVLLGIRAVGQLLIGLGSEGAGLIIYLALAAIYIAAIVGIVKRKKWAPILVIIVGVLDAISAIIALDGATAFGAIIMDAALVVLAVLQKKALETGPKKMA